MNIDFYRNFLVIAEVGTIAGAAAKLSIAQTALSAQVRELESYYGTKLISTRKGQRRLQITEAGYSLIRKTRQLLELEDSRQMEMQSYNDNTKGSLRISVSPAVSNNIVRRFLIPFSERYPEISFQYRQEPVAQQFQSINNGISEISFSSAPFFDTQGCEKLVLPNRYYLYALYSDKSDFRYEGDTMSITELKNRPLACSFVYSHYIAKAFMEYGMRPKFSLLANSGSAAIEFVREGKGIAIYGASSGRELPKNLRWVRLKEDILTFDLLLYWSTKTNLSKAGRLFLDFVKERLEDEL